MTIFITGTDGYCGWPVLLRLLAKTNETIIAVDNGSRRQWVSDVGSSSLIPIADFDKRMSEIDSMFPNRVHFFNYDLTFASNVRYLLREFKPDIVLHLAAQPSAPYSQIDLDRCNFTQHNNMQMTRNLLWNIKDMELPCRFVITTTTGIYGAPDFDIPEGGLVINKEEIPFPAMAGSFYHMSRAFDSSNLWLAHRQFGIPVIELRTSIVCGSSTEETRQSDVLANRFDDDFYFGVVVNRFATQALTNQPLTVYGKGDQSKPIISLEDMVESTVNACFYDKEDYAVFNQVSEVITIKKLANNVKQCVEDVCSTEVEVKHIANPRVEKEEHNMSMDNKRFLKELCGSKIRKSIIGSILQICEDLVEYKSCL